MNYLPFAVLLLLLTACTQAPAENTEIVIGVSTILSGDFASLGRNIANTAELTLNQTPHEGLNIRIVVEDAGCGGGKGLSAAKKLAETDNAKVIIGGTCSGDTLAAAPYLDEQHIVYITPVTGGANIDAAGEYVFRTGNSDLQAGLQPAIDMMRLNQTKVALVTDNADYTLDIRNTFKKEYESLGGTIALDETIAMDEKDLRTLILKIKNEDPQAVMISSQLGTTGGYFIKQAREQGLTVPIYTTFTTVVSSTAKDIAGEAMEGAYFYDPSYAETSEEWTAFLQSYREMYGQDPAINFHAAATYDSVKMTIEAIQAVGNDGQKIHDYLLEHMNNREGLSGTISFDEQGNVDTGFTLKKVHNGTFIAP